MVDDLVISGLYETIQSHEDNCDCSICVRYYYLINNREEE